MKISTIDYWEKTIQLAISLSHDDPHGERSLKTVAAMIGSSVDNFSHKFAQVYGMSYKHYTKRRRLEAGAGYLRHSDFNVGQISEMCGYTQSSFTKAFREVYNQAPMSFRDQLYLPNEIHTLERTKIASNPHDDPHHLIFTPDRTEDVRLPEYRLYYNILPRNNDPVRSMVEYASKYQQQLYIIKAGLGLSDTMIITGTLDVVPVTAYSRMLMYAGIIVPLERGYEMAHQQIQRSSRNRLAFLPNRFPEGITRNCRCR